MSLSEVKMKALEMMWKAGRPVRSRDVAHQLSLSVPPTNLHLVWLRRKGYVLSPEKGLYAITETGKEALVLPKINCKQALQILSNVPREKAFHFYYGMDLYSQTYATNLRDFCDKIQALDTKSLEFHLARKDFELWFLGLGDFKLARKMSAIRETGLLGETLRKKVYEVVKSRCQELEGLSSKLVYVK